MTPAKLNENFRDQVSILSKNFVACRFSYQTMSTLDAVKARSRRDILLEIRSALIEGTYNLSSLEIKTCLGALERLVENASGSSLNSKDFQGDLLLSTGARKGCGQMVCQLLAAGIGPELRFSEASSLYIAALGGHLEVIAALVEGGASLEKGDSLGSTPISCAAGHGHTEIVRLLAKAGADLNSESVSGWTPLSKAALMGHLGSVRALVEAGATVNRPVHPAAPGKPTKRGSTALIAAIDSGREDVVEFLLKAGADVELAHGPNGTTPLIGAAASGHVGVTRLLVEAGADKEAVTHDGNTALILAAAGRNVGVVRYLVENGANINHVVAEAGVTPLHAACEFGSLEIIKFLVEAGASLSAITARGSTPLSLAANSGSAEAVEYLLLKGARDSKMKVSFGT